MIKADTHISDGMSKSGAKARKKALTRSAWTRDFFIPLTFEEEKADILHDKKQGMDEELATDFSEQVLLETHLEG
ncbi:CLUMA_CG007546, isoform A [Clunio marinus]|uniref:CLUMA_CG007546, isoform A n=1 Tax=Clunio marinus TaxID=568069 RepID=A0A1J1I162_9DIPT|nr:CLUMA_CG007546, isoform A [Clunio marinus]